MIDSQEPARQPLPLALQGGDFFCTVKPRLARQYNDIHDLLMIFMGMWVIVNWWVWSVPDFHFRKLEAMTPTHTHTLIFFRTNHNSQLNDEDVQCDQLFISWSDWLFNSWFDRRQTYFHNIHKLILGPIIAVGPNPEYMHNINGSFDFLV